MYGEYFNVMGYSALPAGFLTLIVLLSIWSVIWKGFALWKAARNSSKPWFIVLLVINTAGILEILYFFFFSKKKEEQTQNNPPQM